MKSRKLKPYFITIGVAFACLILFFHYAPNWLLALWFLALLIGNSAVAFMEMDIDKKQNELQKIKDLLNESIKSRSNDEAVKK